MDNGFDYPNDLCVQNALWRRLDAIEILQIRLDKSQNSTLVQYRFALFYCSITDELLIMKEVTFSQQKK